MSNISIELNVKEAMCLVDLLGARVIEIEEGTPSHECDEEMAILGSITQKLKEKALERALAESPVRLWRWAAMTITGVYTGSVEGKVEEGETEEHAMQQVEECVRKYLSERNEMVVICFVSNRDLFMMPIFPHTMEKIHIRHTFK